MLTEWELGAYLRQATRSVFRLERLRSCSRCTACTGTNGAAS